MKANSVRDRPSEAPPDEEQRLLQAVRRLNSRVLGLVLGVVCGLVLFVATNWLVLKGGDPVGPHLSLLGQYFPGYRVTFGGSLLGFVYAFVVGYLTGWLIAAVYNGVAAFRQRRS